MAHIIYCSCCESARVETTETPTTETFYMCTMCRDYCQHLDVDVRENNLNQQQVIEYSN